MPDNTSRVSLSYTVAKLEVALQHGDSLTLRHSSHNYDQYILIRINEIKAVLYNVKTKELAGGAPFALAFNDDAAPLIDDPENPGISIPDPDFEPVCDLKDVLEVLRGERSIRKAIKAGWRFPEYERILEVVYNENLDIPEEEL